MNPSRRCLSIPSPNSSILLSARQSVVAGGPQWPFPSRCPSRPFSQCLSKQAKGKMAPGVKMPRVKTPPAPSMKIQRENAMAKLDRSTMPEDVGLLPGTFIRPMMGNMPSLFKDFKRRWTMETAWFRCWFQGVGSVVTYNKHFNKGLPMRIRERKKVAVDLHKKMYQAFADGNVEKLKEICCDHLAEDFARRIQRRPRHSPKLKWTLHEYMGITGIRVISDRAAALPEKPGLGLRQVVVRIRSKQSLKKPPPPAPTYSRSQQQKQAEVEEKSEEKTQECTEYIVIQRFMVDHEDGDWKVWGLAKETTPNVVETDPSFAPGLGLRDRLSAVTGR